MTVDVEAKAKELAVTRLMQDLAEKSIKRSSFSLDEHRSGKTRSYTVTYIICMTDRNICHTRLDKHFRLTYL